MVKEKIDLRGFNGREMFQQMIRNVRNRRGYLAAQREELEKELSRLRCGSVFLMRRFMLVDQS